jgi:carbamoyl-phosphate synthase large subunit
MGLPVTMIARKLSEGSPNVVDVIYDGKVGAVINTVEETAAAMRDGFEIRRAAVERRIPCFTSLDTARASVGNLIRAVGGFNVMRLDEYLAGKSAM